jgi:hypothetical protein
MVKRFITLYIDSIMTKDFVPQSDFMLPIGVFAERVLGDSITPEIKEESAQVQALLIVLAKHMLIPEELAETDIAKYKSDQLFRQIHKDPAMLKSELDDIVPAEYDLEGDIEQARDLVNKGQGVPHVPPFGAILAKRIPRDTVNHCLTMQAGLRVMAMVEQWDGFERIVPARIFDNDPPVLNMAQAALNNVYAHTVARVKDGYAIEANMQNAFSAAYHLGHNVVSYARDRLHEQGFHHVLQDNLYISGNTEQTIAQRVQHLDKLLGQGGPSAAGPALTL